MADIIQRPESSIATRFCSAIPRYLLVSTRRSAGRASSRFSRIHLRPHAGAMEYMSLSCTPYDIDRFGALLPRFTPRQADLLMVIGTVTVRQGPILKRVYDQMTEPKWVMAFGACASTGGFYDNYATLPGIDKIIPVDVYVPGCPPRRRACSTR